jgi:hypothetical protein
MGLLHTGPDRPGVNDVQPMIFRNRPVGGEQVEIKRVVAYLPAMIQRICTIAGWLALAFIAYATLSPIEARPVFAGPQLEHFAAFALVGLAFAVAYPNRVVFVVVIVVGAAVGLEALQLLTPDRHGRVIDALVKALGGIFGISAGQLVLFQLRLKSARSNGPI